MAETQTNAAKPPKEKLDPKVFKAAIILVFGALASQLNSTMINVAIKTLTIDLKSTVSVIQWVITAFILAMGLAVPVSGWANKRFGGKKVYMFSLIVFMAGSVLCSQAWDVGSLIGFRFLQGIGAGLMIPTLQTLLVHISGGRNLGSIMSVVSIPALLGPILGPVLGGVIIDSLNWHWIFYVNIPISMIALFLAWRGLPADEPANGKQPLDVTGLMLLSPAFALIIYGISQISRHGGIVPLLTGLVLLGAFIAYALRTKKEPVVDLRLFQSRNFSASNIMLFLSGMVMNGTLLLIPLYYQQVRGESVMHTGLLLIPQGIGMLLTRSWIGKLADRIGSRIIVIVSLVFTIAGTLPFTFAGPDTNLYLLAAAMVVQGAALNGLLIPIMASAYVGLRKDQVPHASVSTRIFQTIGGAFGSAILATVLGQRLSGAVTPNIQRVAGAYHTAFWWSIGFSVAAFIPALLLSVRKKPLATAQANS